jgi:hypothetical protein
MRQGWPLSFLSWKNRSVVEKITGIKDISSCDLFIDGSAKKFHLLTNGSGFKLMAHFDSF